MTLYIICGVSGSGKTTIGQALAKRLSCPFVEGDDFHPDSNIDKMASSTPLTDADRTAWLEAITTHLKTQTHIQSVLACSALTPYVQNFLSQAFGDKITWVKLEVSRECAKNRMESREHFMPPALLDSQFAAWTPPQSGLTISADKPIDEIIGQIINS